MSNDKVSTNPLFSSTNVVNFSTSSLLMPLQEQSSAILASDKEIEEEGSFIGQNVESQDRQNLATFTLFSQKNDVISDPFANVASAKGIKQPMSLQSKVVTSVQHEPQLFVPPSSPKDHYITGEVVDKPTTTSGIIHAPSLLAGGSPIVSNANPYSRAATGGSKPRPMFPSSSQFYQTSADYLLSSKPSSPPSSFVEDSNKVSTHSSTENSQSFNVSSVPNSEIFLPMVPHWFYCKSAECCSIWCPFSYHDSAMLEKCFQAEIRGEADGDVISTNGGRYDVSLSQRSRKSVFWDEPPSLIRRCTWFYKGDNESHFTPYEENLCNKLEMEYENVVKQGLWHKAIDLGNKETIVVHNPQLIVHYQPDPFGNDFGGVHDKQQRSKVVKRGISTTDFVTQIPPAETGTADHLVFFCHGVGPVCDLRSRSIVECVDDFRSIHLSLLESHFKKAVDAGEAHRIEFLPIHWHRALHGDATGVDRNIRRLTLPSISRLRHFTNETLLDILFYSSPVYCQTIAETVGNEINFLYQRFMSRNPNFNGKVSLAGHSLGSLILFDLLCHQADQVAPTPKPSLINGKEIVSPKSSPTKLTLQEALKQLNLSSLQQKFENEEMDMDTLVLCSEDDLKSIGLPLGPRKKLMSFLKEYEANFLESKVDVVDPPGGDAPKPPLQMCESIDHPLFGISASMNVHVDFQQFDSGTGQPSVCYPKLDFNPHALFALGSPIGMFLTVRGIGELGEDFVLPTCPNFINIFHPFDPVAYRVEPLINPDVSLKPVLIPHYKGRKRLHLELKESLGRMGQELKEGIIRAIGSMQKFAKSHWSQAAVEEEVKNATEELIRDGQERAAENEDAVSVASDPPLEDVDLGKLNGGKRIDYVLQERPLESFNDYLFAFQSHLCYWSSEDTVLFMMKEAYEANGVSADNKLPST